MFASQVFNVQLTNGEIYAYRKAGHGPRDLLLVHGNLSSSQHFQPLIPFLKKHFTMYAPDMRGFGCSSYFRPVRSIQDLADDLRDFVNLLGLQSFAVLGWSAGGPVAMQLALDIPGQIQAMALVAGVGCMGVPIFDPQGKPYASMVDMAGEPGQIKPLLWALLTHNVIFMERLWNNTVYTKNKPSRVDSSIYIHASLRQRNLVEIYWSLAHFNLSNQFNGYVAGNGRIKDIKTPALLLWGEDDIIIGKKGVESTASALHAPLVVLPDCGHSPFVDCPDLLASKVDEFLSSIPSS